MPSAEIVLRPCLVDVRRPGGRSGRGEAVRIIDVSIASRGVHALALSDDGEVFAWGCGDNGRLGCGDVEDREVPTRVWGQWGTGEEAGAGGGGDALGVNGFQDMIHEAVGMLADHGGGGGGLGGLRAVMDHLGVGWKEITKVRREILEEGRRGVGVGVGGGQVGLGEMEGPVVSVSCGEMHSVALLETGALYVWGTLEQGRLGVKWSEVCEDVELSSGGGGEACGVGGVGEDGGGRGEGNMAVGESKGASRVSAIEMWSNLSAADVAWGDYGLDPPETDTYLHVPFRATGMRGMRRVRGAGACSLASAAGVSDQEVTAEDDGVAGVGLGGAEAVVVEVVCGPSHVCAFVDGRSVERVRGAGG